MAGLGQALTSVNQANQRAAALRRFNPAALGQLEQFLSLDPRQQALEAAQLELLRRAMGGKQTAPGAATLGAAAAGGATPSFERTSDERRLLDVFVEQGPEGDAERRRLRAGMIEGPEARALAAMQGPAAPPFTRIAGGRPTVVLPEMFAQAPPQAVAARGAPTGGFGGGGDLPGAGLPSELAALLAGIQPSRTRGEFARTQPLLQHIEGLLAAEQQRGMQRELAALREAGLAGRAAAKEEGVERRHGEKLSQQEKLAGTAEGGRQIRFEQEMVLKGRAQEALDKYHRALLNLSTASNQRDAFFDLVRSYSQVGNMLRDDEQRGKIMTQLGAEVASEMKARGFPEEITKGVVGEQPGMIDRALDWIKTKFGAGSPETPKSKTPAGVTLTFED